MEAELGIRQALFDQVSPGRAIILADFGRSTYYEQHGAGKAWFAGKNLMLFDLPYRPGLGN